MSGADTLTRPPVTSDHVMWGIVADLTPPELQEARRLSRLRRQLAVAAIGVTCVALLAFGAVWFRNHSAGNDLASAQARSAALRKQAANYSQVTTMKATVAQVKSRLATLMAGDVDVPALLAAIVHAAPPGVQITQFSVTLTPKSPTTTSAPATGSLDTSGRREIGTAQLSGNGHVIDDLPAFVANLATVPGVVNVLPLTNAVSAGGTQFTVSFSVTDVRLSGRFTGTGGGSR